ncbi:DEP domain-containing protein 1A isoform X3 [Phascolarctos cinereus]|uniref:DEP domain-containing protein 1A isoform X4 n=1 Tax=Phascolarctos cinereus TaxID=38626 RepID=A0A6P5KZI7_PHACI|nr:DEP domain-containing protein 1A isoform X4 [Phascolarctos cinereus]
MESRGVTTGPYRATKLWNEVTTCFRAGMPLRKHRQHFKKHGNCFTACEAVDWLYELLRSNSNFGPEVTRQQTVQLLRKFLKNHVIEDVKGRWGSENLDDNSQLFRFPTTSPLKSVPRHRPELRKSSLENISKEKESIFKLRHLSRRTPKKHVYQEITENVKIETGDENKENPVEEREISQEDVEEMWRHIILMHLQTILGTPSLEEVLDPAQVIPQYITYNMANTSKHGVVVLQNKAGLLQPHLERIAVDALQICCLLLPPPNRRKLQLLMRMISRMSQNVDMPKLHDVVGTRSLMIQTFSRCVLRCAEEVDLDELLAARLVSFLMDHHQEVLQVPSHLQAAVEKHLDDLRKGHITCPGDELIAALPTYSYCKQISTQEFDEQKVSTSQVAIAELLENIIKDKSLPLKEKKKKLKQFQKEYPAIYQKRFPTTESEAALFGDKPTIKQPMLILRKPKFRSLRH